MTRWEAEEVARGMLGSNLVNACDTLVGPDARLEPILNRLKAVRLGHFACHGRIDRFQPLNSALSLSGGDRLSVEQLLSADELEKSPLITLSACASAVSGVTADSDALGLPAAFIAMGAPSVVAALYPVEDLATALLMQRLYQLLSEGVPIAEALRQAQVYLRSLSTTEARRLAEEAIREMSSSVSEGELRPYQERIRRWADDPFTDPYYWSAFVVLGSPSYTATPEAGQNQLRDQPAPKWVHKWVYFTQKPES
jgi:CHAT domain-containing protein